VISDICRGINEIRSSAMSRNVYWYSKSYRRFGMSRNTYWYSKVTDISGCQATYMDISTDVSGCHATYIGTVKVTEVSRCQATYMGIELPTFPDVMQHILLVRAKFRDVTQRYWYSQLPTFREVTQRIMVQSERRFGMSRNVYWYSHSYRRFGTN
jgi:hypothetical protein